MVRFNDKPSIQTSDISNDDILPITDLSDSSSDKKITLGQLGDFIQNRGNLAQQDLSNTGMLTDVILKAPNGVFEIGENNDSIIVKSDLNILMPNGKDSDKKLQNIDLTVEEDIEQSVAILSNGEYYVFITDEQTIFFALTTDVFPSYFEPQNPTNNTYWYDINNNLWKNYNGTTWTTVNISELGFIDIENGEISQINPDQVAFIPNGQLVALRDLSNLSKDGENHFANKDLDNLTEIGLKKIAKEQLTKFSINNGKMTNGVEDILITNSSQQDLSFVQPILTENGTIGGSDFAVSGGYANLAYKAFDGDNSSICQFQLGQWELIMYFPIATKVTQFVNSWIYYAPLAYKISASNDNATYTDLITITNVNWIDVIDLSSNQNYYQYYKITITSTAHPNYVADLNNVQITGSYIIGQGGQLLYYNVDENNPITYTNCNGETFIKTALSSIDVSSQADGIYNVMLDSTNQPYLHSGNIYYQKSEPTSLVEGDIWLNKNNQKAYKYVADELVELTDVPCGKVNIASGIITNVEQPRFNELRYKYSSVKSNKYVDVIAGASGTPYTAKADGYLWINIRIPTLGNAVYINYEDGSQTLMRASLANSTYSLFSQNIRKGDTVIYGFDSAVAESVILRFIYAESEV